MGGDLTYLCDGDGAFLDDKLVRGEAPDFFLVGGVAEFVESLVAFVGESYDDQAFVALFGLFVVGAGVGANDLDELVLVGARDRDDGGVVRAADEVGGT